jgi:hypothetical protein
MIFLSALPVVFGCIVICAAGSSSAQICFLSDVHGEKQDTHTPKICMVHHIFMKRNGGAAIGPTQR